MPRIRKQSKRVPVRLRHKIEKASAAKQRKNRKIAKKDPTWRSKVKKDPGIPNLFPYKDKILKEVEEGRKRKEEDAERRKERQRVARAGVAPAVNGENAAIEQDIEEDGDSDELLDIDSDASDAEAGAEADEEMADASIADSSNPMAALLASARARAADYDPANASDADDADSMSDASSSDSFTAFSPPPKTKTNSKANKDTVTRTHASTLTSLIAQSDILLYILDARDPLSTRSPTIESSILTNPDKRLILILNKIDLIPPHLLQDWLLHLRQSFPTLPLRSAQTSAPSAKTFQHPHLTPASTASTLIKALKSYATPRTSTTVGIIGYPNVGKSSVVNALTSRLSGRAHGSSKRGGGKECPVGAEAGVTTTLREVKLDAKIRLVDSPGVVFPTAGTAGASTSTSTATNTVGAKDGRSNGRGKDDTHKANLILLNALPPHEITDPIPAISLLLRRLADSPNNGELLKRLLDEYGLPALMASSVSETSTGTSTRQSSGTSGTRQTSNTAQGETSRQKDITTDFLLQVARKRGRLGKGGVPNLHAAAQSVLADWRDGRVQGWVAAPPSTGTGNMGDANGEVGAQRKGGAGVESKDQKEIVTQWSKEFKIEGLFGDDEVDDVSGGLVEDEGGVSLVRDADMRVS